LKQSKALVTTCIDRKVILSVPGLHYDALGCRIGFTYSSFKFSVYVLTFLQGKVKSF
jgi:hypothetical protein